MIDNHQRTNFLHRLLSQTRSRYRELYRSFIGCATYALAALSFGAISPWLALSGVIVIAALVARAYRDLRRAYATVEAVYRREDAKCKPWG